MQPINTEAAPAAIGPYSQAMRCGDLLLVSGQIPLDPTTGEMVSDAFEAQAVQVFENLKAVIEAGEANLAQVAKLTLYLTDLGQFATVNNVMERYFAAPFPARAAVEVSALPRGAQIEADAIVCLSR